MRRAWMAIAVIALARVAYLMWLSPYELVADEAQYWDWSRRLSWSYYSKGPGIAWLIAVSTSLFGTHEWTVRLPAALAFAITAFSLAQLAAAFSSDRSTAPRAALIAALLVSLLPVYQLMAILMTTDAPFIACWAVAVL
jgi:4-amino-4-deoxy-L-arabinose transferase-like glycosyltransferase